MYNVYLINPETGELGRLIEECINNIDRYKDREDAFITINKAWKEKHIQ